MPFTKIIGQKSIVNCLLVSVNASEGAKLAQPLFFGEKGLGKTQLAKPYAKAMADKLECKVTFFNTPLDARSDESAEWQAFLQFLDAETGVLMMDEFHEMSIKPTVQMMKMQSFLLKCLDAQNEGRSIPLDLDHSYTYDKCKKVIIGMSNYSEKINPALASRMDVCELQPYSAEELGQICVQMLENVGMVAECEKTVALLAKASRGTARPLYNMIQQFSRIGCQTITRELTITTMRDMGMFPCGLTKHEIHLLQIANKPTTKSIAQMMVTGLQSNMSKSIAYLMGIDLMEALSGSQIKTSKKGNRFLEQLTRAGFIS
jgi:Holliday junction resolvasome RuvABC ATP-dependent DNA helicase subunit